MKKKHAKKIIYFFGFLFLIVICYIFLEVVKDEPTSIQSYETVSSEFGQNLYNPETILSSIENREAKIFTELEHGLGDIPPENYINENDFSDEELFEIAQYFLEQQWNDNPEDWRLVGIKYRLYDCEKGFDGPYAVSYTFEKKIKKNSEEYVHERHIWIGVWQNEIVWYEKVENRKRLTKAINWEDIEFPAMDAYHVAEGNGGNEIHSEIENDCVYVFIDIYTNKDGWIVSYGDETGKGLLDIYIDSYSGKVKR